MNSREEDKDQGETDVAKTRKLHPMRNSLCEDQVHDRRKKKPGHVSDPSANCGIHRRARGCMFLKSGLLKFAVSTFALGNTCLQSN